MGVIHESNASIVVISAGGSFHTAGHCKYGSGIVCDSVAGMEEPRLARASA